ncbi:chromatin remodeling complex subunit [Coniophora puteana RWD-64-598 SS2]|uniref:Chromatin remodeling complex subunit n=1 Tax=Coniophora puteana (strain RWD-64-598) TaxID=741705 RepID=A0A5M3N4M6_CONPW|nr:chromatin remodeling complex subunit [Coniophora puteana RWD-64-598 SS2]EIW86258.1 chromatin remodeling complex subunit [Coniophora puteana RWD-64-598 SS2]
MSDATADGVPAVPVHYVPIPTLPTPTPRDDYAPFSGTRTPLVIDNGATQLRFGFSTTPGGKDEANTSPHVNTNAIAKYKERKHGTSLLLFGDAIESESGARSQIRTPWEGDVLLNFDALENALDCAFLKLGICDTETVEHPVLMTERLCSPLHSRSLTSELMFELYGVPSLLYCVDSVMSFYQNNKPPSSGAFDTDGLVISFNTASTSVIPMVKGKGLLSHAKRIPWGAQQATDYLLKTTQLKYPNFPTRVTPAQSSWMMQNFCEFAPDYLEQIRRLRQPDALRAGARIIQFPFALPVVEEKTEEELARVAERRREQGKKLQEIAAKNRQEKLEAKERDRDFMLKLKEDRPDTKREWMSVLRGEGFDDEDSFEQTLKKLEADIKRGRKKDTDVEEPAEEPTFPLLDVPDADLDEDQLKEKKKQRLLKAGYDARLKARREKEKEREEKEAEERREEDERENNFGEWSRRLRAEQEAIMVRMKERSRRKAALADRKSAAAQARMKNIATLAADDRVNKKKRKAAGGEDMFGADDADWAIYRKINTAVESSDEEEDYSQLQTIENKLLAHDPTFTLAHTHAAITSQKSAMLSAFRPPYEEGDVEGNTRIHLNVERWRVCETWFSPGMAGVDSAGLGEVLQGVLARFSDAEKARMVQNVFVTGSPSKLPGLTDRIYSTLRPILPPEMHLGEIVRAADPSLDAWRGMAAFANTDEFSKYGVTKEEYEELGGERIKRWWGGNWNQSVSP